MLKLATVLSLATALLAAPAWAQPTAAKTALAERYIAAMHLETMMASVMNSIMPLMLERQAARTGRPITAETKAAISKAAAESGRAMTPAMIAVMIPALAETFTEAELSAAVIYYESPVAQSLLAKMPAYNARAIAAMGVLMPAIEADIEARICKAVSCPPK